MKTLERNNATRPLSAYTSEVAEEPLVVTVDGEPIAALMAITNADLETVSLSTNPQFLELIERSRERQKREGGISSAEMRRRLGLESPED
jgi:antitoxin (DNA-binding transcriptional repressor) of toxin-antitoxin stability system